MIELIIFDLKNYKINGLDKICEHLKPLTDISFCVSYLWLDTWITKNINNLDLLYLSLHSKDNVPVAFYPLYLKKVHFGYELRFIGTGETEKAEVASEFQDFIINPLYISESLKLFTEQVEQLNRCVKISFEHVLPDSLCMQWLKSYKKFGWQLQEQLIGKRFRLDVLTSEQQQISQFPHTTLRRQARRFTEREDVQIAYCDEDFKIMDYFNELIELHTLQWQKRGKPGAFTTQVFRQFHLDLASALLNKNQLLLFKLIIQEECIAVFYGFYHQDTLYYYQSGINENSPLLNTGVAMHLIAMRHAREKQIKFYDLMAGKANSYKAQYVNTDTKVYSISYVAYWFSAIKPLRNLMLRVRIFFKKG
ncbi:GNAT family N-acetyltransferase [Rheinheimera sp. UJ51]|uniref:GNAT family N-acetyltransferase n=1 Tax=Rheinheimera sp. UJ51 TaxID=2892446 RepID=UPI001E59A17F|nr:GNAT family N-acetyltransferase [Rheinheimera sp. UJ51]MCC5451119.1 GNAT family N-acetyltransferase [Rheinheimera sp. UJ51]